MSLYLKKKKNEFSVLTMILSFFSVSDETIGHGWRKIMETRLGH